MKKVCEANLKEGRYIEEDVIIEEDMNIEEVRFLPMY